MAETPEEQIARLESEIAHVEHEMGQEIERLNRKLAIQVTEINRFADALSDLKCACDVLQHAASPATPAT